MPDKIGFTIYSVKSTIEPPWMTRDSSVDGYI